MQSKLWTPIRLGRWSSFFLASITRTVALGGRVAFNNAGWPQLNVSVYLLWLQLDFAIYDRVKSQYYHENYNENFN